jgi:hypothetical protein
MVLFLFPDVSMPVPTGVVDEAGNFTGVAITFDLASGV